MIPSARPSRGVPKFHATRGAHFLGERYEHGRPLLTQPFAVPSGTSKTSAISA
jgi:hypothetical protein